MWGLSHVSKKQGDFLWKWGERFVIFLPSVFLGKKCWAMEDAHMWTPSSSSSSSSKAFIALKTWKILPWKKGTKSIFSGARYMILPHQKWMKKSQNVPVWFTKKMLLAQHNYYRVRHGWWKAQGAATYIAPAEKSVINMIWLLLLSVSVWLVHHND